MLQYQLLIKSATCQNIGNNPASVFITHTLCKTSPITWARVDWYWFKYQCPKDPDIFPKDISSVVFSLKVSQISYVLRLRDHSVQQYRCEAVEGDLFGEGFIISLSKAWAFVFYFIWHSKYQQCYFTEARWSEYNKSLSHTSEEHILFLALFSTAKIKAWAPKPRSLLILGNTNIQYTNIHGEYSASSTGIIAHRVWGGSEAEAHYLNGKKNYTGVFLHTSSHFKATSGKYRLSHGKLEWAEHLAD